jgi:hypothetical protein
MKINGVEQSSRPVAMNDARVDLPVPGRKKDVNAAYEAWLTRKGLKGAAAGKKLREEIAARKGKK